MWNRAKTVLATMILIAASLTVYFSICLKTFTQNISKTPKDLLPDTVRFVFHSAPPPHAYTSWVKVSQDTFIALALEFNVTTIYYYWEEEGTVYSFLYEVYFQGIYSPTPAPDVDTYFGTVYEDWQRFS